MLYMATDKPAHLGSKFLSYVSVVNSPIVVELEWYNEPTMLPANGRQHRGCIIPQAVTHSLVLLKMVKIISRNMLS